MGVPVVSLVGERFAARTGLSILSAAGRPEWAVESEDAYVKRVVELGGDLDRLERIRSSLRSEVATSPLVDSRALTRSLEDVLFDLAFSGDSSARRALG
jgi:predicted O-linked N-acetylglucosamine transferase (SPINDLY family)